MDNGNLGHYITHEPALAQAFKEDVASRTRRQAGSSLGPFDLQENMDYSE